MDVSLQRSLSVLDRLLLTHSIWLQLSINLDSAQQILQREIIGTFLVCKCSATHKKVLCVRVQEARESVSQYPIREEDSTFSLESSALSFPDLCRLVAFYTVSRDVLPFPLELPEVIAQATTHTQLENISHLGFEFWSSQTSPGLPNGPPPHGTSRVISPCFINPLFLQPPQPSRAASHKRHRFKRSLRVHVSNETSLSLSGESDPTQGETHGQNSSQGGQRRIGGMNVLRRIPALSPTSEEEDEQMLELIPPVNSNSLPQRDNAEDNKDPEDGEVCLALERTRAPSLAELDSNSSFSSLEEEDAQADSTHQWPPVTRGSRFPSANPTSTLRRMTAAFVCVFAPERRVARLVDELSHDRRSTFGSLVQDFLEKQRQEMEASVLTSTVELLQGIRRFLSQAKSLLLEAGEIEPPIETLVPENEKDLVLEKALFGCVLKPLKVQLQQMLVSLHTRDGSLQRITDSMLACQEGTLELLGVRVGFLDIRDIDRAKKKFTLMQRSHSPIDKVLLLLQVCKSVYKAMGTQPDHEVGSEDFLPALSYVLVQCNIPQLLLETEYMMELLEPSWLTGEGGYYLTSVYASLWLIQSKPGSTPTCSLTNEAQESLREWSRRRGQEAKAQKDSQQKQRFVRVLFQDESRSAVRTLLWKAGENVDALAQTCAGLFDVNDPQHYCLFWRSEGEMRPLPAHVQPHELGMHEGGSLSYLHSDHDFSKVRRLTREGAVDLGESVCEE
ncbi:ras and Rab interactor 2-like [Myxocyprinus asiaticus]|uniref:ras and Rab interactor 2-like n=1 Tax=Myxocyprinus asiaticus TaxID=70543 RepID=UPI00222309A9|nr:ras and Rab interactor 2-like [Myxocyprinus asiaticus]